LTKGAVVPEWTDAYDRRHDQRVVREEEIYLGDDVYDVRLAITDELPPVAHVTTAHCLAFDGDAILLTNHRARGWTIPGGHLEDGESPEEAMRREAHEEAGLTVGACRVVASERIAARGAPPPNLAYPQPGYQVFYVARVAGLGALGSQDESTESRVFTRAEARHASHWVVRHAELYDAALALSREL
jgi:8-oxo-dGTP diphosphatase